MPAPDQPQPQYQPQYYQPQASAPPPLERPKPTTVRQDISPQVPPIYLAICITGLIILTIGAIIGHSTYLIDDYDLARDVRIYGQIIMLVGVSLLSIGLLSAGFAAKDLSPRNRSTLYLAAVIIIVVILIWPSW
jgi:xanthine/uracil permease